MFVLRGQKDNVKREYPAKTTKLLEISFITKIYLYNFDPLKPHFYIVKLGFTGVYIVLLISAQKHRLYQPNNKLVQESK